MSEREAAASLSVAPGTAHKWKARYLGASEAERASGVWALDRSSRPHRSPRRTSAEVEARVCEARERTGWGPRLIAGETGVAHSTVHAILRRHGRSRIPRAPKAKFVRYEWPCPGDLLHMDVKRYPRFRRPGHAATGDRRVTFKNKINRLGHDYFHAVVDDHSRLAYGELLADEKADTVTGFLERALAWFAEREITPRRLMTDGAWSYTRNRTLRELLTQHEIRHIVTPAYTPRWNGKVERFHQTMEREWAKGVRYRNSTARNRALPHWLRYYNERRPHSSLSGQPPISRARNLSGQDS
ncbi:MAG: IS481 family transposase [Solirubrobacterales bacterium]|nr:IS481 family transposase [Solirubrobacterales bacterium]